MNKSYTQQQEDSLYQKWGEYDNSDYDYSALIEELNDENTFRSFGDGLLYFLQKKQPNLTIDNAIKYIESLCEETGVSKSDIGSTNTLKSWFKGGPRPKKSEDARMSMFALSFALSLTPDETAELFHKVYLDRAFDYRNEKEIICYYCLNNHKSWQDANRLFKSIKCDEIKSADTTVYTYQLKDDIESISEENDLISYIKTHSHNLAKKSVSAKHTVQKLLADANKTAKAESESPDNTEYFRGSDRNSLNFTYEVITNLPASEGNGTKTFFKNARLPKEIKNRFPEAVTLSKKDPTYEELRKLIILLFSYVHWYKLQAQMIEIEDYTIDDYISEVDNYLRISGLSLMYYGNPYDWMFLFCALTERPLDTFRELIAEVLE